MKLPKFLLLFAAINFIIAKVSAQENAAPSIHMNYYFPSNDAILKMQKIKIVESAYASYFEVNSFTDGYAGLQQTPDGSFGNSNILISSLWDVNTAEGIYSSVEYHDPTTFTSRFGGEGDGWKTINPYGWKLNTWYNLVNRSWKSKGRLYIATFLNNVSTGKWFHTATLSIPDPGKYLTGYNDAFLENWDGGNPSWNGSFIRKAFFKDCWNLNTNGVWEKNTSAHFSANNSQADINRNGIYHNSFNAYFDNTEDAYCMQHGGSTTPSAAFNGGRTLNLPAQTNQGDAPTLTTAGISSVTANYNKGTTNISWTIDEFKSPQLSAKIDILDESDNVLKTVQDTMPERRSVAIKETLNNGNYTARVTVWDIFNQNPQTSSSTFAVTGGLPLKLLTFKGHLEDGSIILQWQTSDELNTSHFDILRSEDGSNFRAIAGQEALNNSIFNNNYSYTDEALNTFYSQVYYRLQMFDKDGSSTLSKIISINLPSGNTGIKISPNPAKSYISVTGSDLKQITIIDSYGKPVLKLNTPKNKTLVNVSFLPKGVYIVTVANPNNQLNKKKLLIE